MSVNEISPYVGFELYFPRATFSRMYDRNLSQGRGLFLYLQRRDERGGRIVPMLISLSPPLLFFPFFFLLITVHDRHAEREESNQGMVGEDISGQGREKNVFRGDVYGLYGVAVFFLQKRDLFIYRIWFFSIFENEIWLINILTFLP